MFRTVALALIVAATAWFAFQPAAANHFGYALPARNGLPCRIVYAGRHYDNDNQCEGYNLSAWARWYAATHHTPIGGSCSTRSDLKKSSSLPLRQVGSISTLLGATHPVLAPHPDHPGIGTNTVLYVAAGGCYRPYALSGGP